MGTVIPFPTRTLEPALALQPPPRRATGEHWTERSACHDHDPRLWFTRGDVEVAKAICGMCPVRMSCLAHALDQGERFGVWGGLDARERRRLRRPRSRARR